MSIHCSVMCLGLVVEVPGAAPGVDVAEVQCLKRLYRESDVGCSCFSSFFSLVFVLVADCVGLIEWVQGSRRGH